MKECQNYYRQFRKFNLKNKTIGLLGLTFKADSDDIRDSLAIKLFKYLKKER